jgi:hypothetical protein
MEPAVFVSEELDPYRVLGRVVDSTRKGHRRRVGDRLVFSTTTA